MRITAKEQGWLTDWGNADKLKLLNEYGHKKDLLVYLADRSAEAGLAQYLKSRRADRE